MAAPSQLGIFVHFLTHSYSNTPPALCCPCVFLLSQVSRSHLPDLNRPETGPGKHPVCLSIGCLAVGGDKPGPCHRDEVVFTQQGNQWGWTSSKHPSAASWLIFISAHNLCILTLPAAVKCGSTDDSHLWVFGMEKGQLSAVSICTVSSQLFIVICALYQYSWFWTPDNNGLVHGQTAAEEKKKAFSSKVHLISSCFSNLEKQFFGGVETKNRTTDCSLEQFSWTFHSHVQYGSTSCKQMWVNRSTNARSGPQGDLIMQCNAGQVSTS